MQLMQLRNFFFCSHYDIPNPKWWFKYICIFAIKHLSIDKCIKNIYAFKNYC
jgi:hypothetical protein